MKLHVFFKKNTLSSLINNRFVHAFLLNLFLGFLTFIPFIIQNRGIFILCDDFNFQQIPFSMLCNDAIKSGEIFWNWNIDLGTPLIEGMSYYTLGSPLFWISLLFPSEAYPYLVGWLYMLNYALAGLFSYSYIQRFVKEKKYALLGSILYAFSGFQAVNLLFFHFYNVVAFFPLLLIGLEEKMINHKKGLLAFSIFLNAFLNYFLFIGEVIFIILYYFIRFGNGIFKNARKFIQTTLSCIGEGILGLAMSAVLFLPSVASILRNPRASVQSNYSLFMSNREYLQLIRALFFPSEIMPSQSIIYESDFSSMAAYLPMVSLSLVLVYVIKQKKDWLSFMIYACLLCTFIPLLNNSFTLFTTSYHRWYYMMILIFSLASSIVLERRSEFPISKITLLSFGLLSCFVIFIFIWDKYKYQTIFNVKDFVLLSAITLLGLLFLGMLNKVITIAHNRYYFFIMLALISIFSIATNFHSLQEYKNFRSVDAAQYYSKIKAFHQITCEDGYRISTNEDDTTDMIRNISMTSSVPAVNTFSSSVHPSIMEFYGSLGLERRVFTPARPVGLDAYLSAKYYVTEVEDTQLVASQIATYKNATYYVYENPDTLPIGFTFDTYLVNSEYRKLDPALRTAALLNTLVIPDAQEQTVSSILRPYSINTDELKDSTLLSSFVKKRAAEASYEFSRDRMTFHSKIKTAEKRYALFSVPYDESWKANVNGIDVPILSSNGLMAIPLEKGENVIQFRYFDYTVMIACIISLLSFLFWLIYRSNLKVKLPKSSSK